MDTDMVELTSDLDLGALVISCETDGCDASLATYGGRLTHHEDGSHTFSYSDADEIVTYVAATEGRVMDTTDPDLLALVVTIGHAVKLTTDQAPTEHWQALTDALIAEHTPEQLASMLTGAAALLARTGRAPIL